MTQSPDERAKGAIAKLTTLALEFNDLAEKMEAIAQRIQTLDQQEGDWIRVMYRDGYVLGLDTLSDQVPYLKLNGRGGGRVVAFRKRHEPTGFEHISSLH